MAEASIAEGGIAESNATGPDPNARRRRWMAVLARASAAEIESLLAAVEPPRPHIRLRGPETGLIMTRGRAGGGGAPFNLGEMTVTRCTVRDAEGRIGHAYVIGRDPRHAELAAMLDAAMQDGARHDVLERTVIAPLAASQEEARAASARRSAATRVQFFTMANMR
ncbi:MAG TPA: phosphonate C-P lyase system protein PhnG [Acetobacteraceae bacterium]|nr:phosphonate C-P lyase system protein PhnG [Acetobacteraceae bacterium]